VAREPDLQGLSAADRDGGAARCVRTAPTRRGDAEAVAAVATGLLHVGLTEVAGSMAAFMGIAIAAWGAYAVHRVRADRSVVDEWGVRLRGTRGLFLVAAAALVPVAIAMGVVGARLGHALATPGLAVLLVLYPFWAFVEQFLLQAMLARNLFARASIPVVTIACSVLFALDHLPQWPLAGATLVLALALTPLYLRTRRLLPLAWFHGWTGALFYVWVLGRDPLREILHLA
jgi:hypothetical protein